MRLVSAIYNDFYPFDCSNFFDEFVVSFDPLDLKQGDVLIVWGGEDISPSLYKHGRSYFSGADILPSRRDQIEWALMQRAKELNIPIIGICRGAQMLCAAAGGYLVQHFDGHNYRHEVETFDGQKFLTNSLHHQMMVPWNTQHKVVAWTTQERPEQYVVCPENQDIFYGPEFMENNPEFVHFTDIKGFAVQWHPEMMDYPVPATSFVEEYIYDQINQSL